MKATSCIVVACSMGLPACVDPPPEQAPELAQLHQDEIIEIHGCRPGSWDVGDGVCIDPWWGDLGGGGGVSEPPAHGPGTPPWVDESGGSDSGTPVPTMDPGVFVKYGTIGGSICRCMCLVLSAEICYAVTVGCGVATTVTIGGLAIPCASALLAACVVGAPAGGQWCSEWVCPD